IGYREKPNEILIENPVLQDVSTARYATLPAGHPLGYHDAVLNLFKDFYEAVKNKKEPAPISRPGFKTGYDEMIILDAILQSKNSRQWVKVKWKG
ncbi:MAG: gfo/Idh/MocA family oxidoreductase, partial [Spirochaetes bacterium]|nr:gfo/Idh/MocA family oxidoreductase [Spirochaetota bacterium]